ncbi:ABC transporter permease [Nocardioides panacisoli]|uniref:ABC transporter permease subunit n=1 Tax=Nocardioides panacisoli TaxID=627624 RepID=UPI001C63A601|nr:ABC transporter permease subunit [Nocardioides panacisoli]QYJ04473.1 ABC transporter permease [Nocardioides panacisoli]
MSTTTATDSATDTRPAPTRPQQRTAPAPIPFTRILGVEFQKMFDTRAGLWLMASVVIVSLLTTAGVIVFADAEDLTYETFGTAVGIPMSVVLPIIAILAVTSEWSQRTALTTFTLVPSRGRVIAAKLVDILVIGLAGMGIAMGAGAVGNVVGTAIAGEDPVWNLETQVFGQLLLAMIITMLVGFALAALFRSTPAAIVGYFVWGMVLPGISGALAGVNQWWFDNAAWFELNTAMFPLYDQVPTGEQWAQLGVTTLIWVVLPCLVGTRLLLRSEVK